MEEAQLGDELRPPLSLTLPITPTPTPNPNPNELRPLLGAADLSEQAGDHSQHT